MRSLYMILMFFIVTLLAVEFSEGQDIPKCATSLAQCAPFLNSTKPDKSCCNALIETVKTQRKCLCDLYNNPDFWKSFGLDRTQAIALIKTCGLDDTICNKDSAPVPAPTPTAKSPIASPAPQSEIMSPPPAGGSDHDHHSGSTINVAWTGITVILLVSATLMLQYCF